MFSRRKSFLTKRFFYRSICVTAFLTAAGGFWLKESGSQSFLFASLIASVAAGDIKLTKWLVETIKHMNGPPKPDEPNRRGRSARL